MVYVCQSRRMFARPVKATLSGSTISSMYTVYTVQYKALIKAIQQANRKYICTTLLFCTVFTGESLVESSSG
jgi:hypothetical protein